MATSPEARRKRIRMILAASPAASGLLVWLIYSVATLPIIAVYNFESSDGGFDDVEVPAKGRTLDQVERDFRDYKAKTGDEDVRLYRTSERDWTNFLLVFDNLLNRRWDYPYTSPNP